MNDDLVRQLRRVRQRLGRTEAKAGPLYLEGTWVPTYLGGTTAGVTTYTTQVGEYTRIGRICFIQGRIEWSAATGTGNAQVSLPFTAINRTNLNGAGSLDISGVTFANSTPSVFFQPGTAVFIMRSPLTNAAPTIVQVEAAGIINFSGVYAVA